MNLDLNTRENMDMNTSIDIIVSNSHNRRVNYSHLNYAFESSKVSCSNLGFDKKTTLEEITLMQPKSRRRLVSVLIAGEYSRQWQKKKTNDPMI